MTKKEYSLSVGGRTLTAEFNDIADQTNGSVMVKYGETVVLATAVMGKKDKDSDYMPLTVDYEEKFYASGRILGSRYVRREGKPSEEAILSGRIVDRTIRPLFEQHIRREIQVVITTLSIGTEDPDIIAVIAASLALGTSDIPWAGPVSAVRIGTVNGKEEFIVNPEINFRDDNTFSMDLVACGKDGNINMIEVASKEIKEKFATNALNKASEEIEKIQKWQKEIIKEIGKTKISLPAPEIPTEIKTIFEEKILPRLSDAVICNEPGKEKTHALEEEFVELLKSAGQEEKIGLGIKIFEDKVNDILHDEAIENNKRADGRGMDDLRGLFAKAGGISSVVHGSGLFYRGGTHVLSVLTLGGPDDSMTIEGTEESSTKRFMHHYNFPPYSSGETGRMGGVNRRAVGHGALAEKAVAAIIPPKEIFPYTIRIVSESMASNGSTSMASVCASTIALMDGGVPIKAPVAGIATGLMMKNENEYKILTDIQGPEDHHGDMDFKVAGSREGITAIQLDVKVDGVPVKILSEAMEKAKSARERILDVIEKEIGKPRETIAESAPKIVKMQIKVDQIGLLIGPGGKMIKEICEKSKADINIEQDGSVYVTGKTEAVAIAQKLIEELTHEYKAGEKYTGKVTRIMDFGAFVNIGGDTEGLVHISEIAPFRVNKVTDILKEGDDVPVIIKEIDEKNRINLSIKMIDPNFAEKKKPSV